MQQSPTLWPHSVTVTSSSERACKDFYMETCFCCIGKQPYSIFYVQIVLEICLLVHYVPAAGEALWQQFDCTALL